MDEEQKVEPTEEKNRENGLPEQISKRKRRVKACVLAGVIALCSFLGGWIGNALTWDSEMRKLNRLKNRIQKSYYEQITDEKFYDVVFAAVNDQLLDEPYVRQKAKGNATIEFPYQVPDGKVFVMGDHRDTSKDSRHKEIGCVDEQDIVGEIVFRVWPFYKIGIIK
jgi:hypothetical protein